MSRRYRGRRTTRGRGISSFMLLIMALVLIAAVTLVVVNIVKSHRFADKPPVDPVQTETEDGIADGTEEQDGSDEADPPAYAVIPLTGDVQQYSSVYRVGDAGYEMYTYVESKAQTYANAVSSAADQLAGTADVYAMVIPLSSGITMPDELMGETVFSDQKTACADIEGMMGTNVKVVPLYDALMQHRTEYLYFRTDHHWTALGAYYAYCQYCAAAGLTPTPLGSYQTRDFPGFLGTFYNDTNKCSQMESNPDTVTAYLPRSSGVTMTVTDTNGNVFEDIPVIYDESSAPAGLKYGAFIMGDNRMTVITNPAVTNGRSCVVVKESFGNAFVPFLSDHYQTVYVIDYRHFQGGSLTEFVRSNGVRDVIFCNNLSAIRSGALMGDLQKNLGL